METTEKKATNGTTIQDVDHQVVPFQPGQVSQPATLEDQIKLEVSKFNLPDAAIEALKEQYGSLTVDGPEDKEGYEAVKDAWHKVRSTRTRLEKKGKDIRADFTEINRAVIAEETRLTKLVRPLEDKLYELWKNVDDQKELDRRRAEQAAEEQLQNRVRELLAAGMHSEEGFYVIGGTISADVATLRGMNEDKYAKFLAAVQVKGAELKAAYEAEQQRQREEREAFQRQQAELKEQQEKFAKDKADFDLKQRAEAQRQYNDKVAFIGAAFENTGMEYRPNLQAYKFSNGVGELVFYVETDILPLDHNEITKLAGRAKAEVDSLKKQQAEIEVAVVAQAEQDRQAQLTDQQRFLEYVRALEAVPAPTLATNHFSLHARNLKHILINFIEKYSHG